MKSSLWKNADREKKEEIVKKTVSDARDLVRKKLKQSLIRETFKK
jgi:hypothetical protein